MGRKAVCKFSIWLPGLDNVDNKFTMLEKPYRLAPQARRC